MRHVEKAYNDFINKHFYGVIEKLVKIVIESHPEFFSSNNSVMGSFMGLNENFDNYKTSEER